MATYKDKMQETIIDAARELFLEKSIAKVFITDIAKKAGIGEATIYRYFKKKQNLALQVAIKEWQSVSKNFKSNNKGRGYERIDDFYQMFLTTFIEHKNFFAFLDEFDQLILNDQTLDHNAYQKSLLEIKNLYDEAYLLGINDHSIKELTNKDLFYYTTTHALLSLCKKLSIDNQFDAYISLKKEEEIAMLIKLITKELKGEEK